METLNPLPESTLTTVRKTIKRNFVYNPTPWKGPKMATPPAPPRYKLIFTVPPSSLEQCKTAIFAKGAGSYPKGNYSLVCFETLGTGQFLPSDNAHPAIGKPGQLERLEEVRVETLCVGEECVREAVKALKKCVI